MKTANDAIKIVGFSLLAGIVGAGIGVLFAPHKGSKTRRKLTKGAKEMADNFQDKMKDEAAVLSDKVEELKDQTMFAIDEIIKDIKHKANELVHY
jgi:gas vesicle protein